MKLIPCRCCHRSNVGPLLHDRPHCKPKTVGQAELIFQLIRINVARIRVVPFIGTQSCQNEQHKGYNNVG